MSISIVALLLSAIGIAAVLLAAPVFYSWFFPGYEVYADASSALKDMLRDLDRARKSLLIICKTCRLDEVAPDEREEFITRLRKKAAGGLKVAVFVEDDSSRELLDVLYREGLIELGPPSVKPSFYGRVIDGSEIVAFHKRGAGLIPGSGRTLYRRTVAPNLARQITALVRAR